MSIVSCHFCNHANPAASKFCNQCGSPLDLKPCPQCEAMNHVAVERCHQCGASFPEIEPSAITEAAANADAPPAAERPLANPGTTTFADRPAPAPDSIPVAFSTRIDADIEPAGAPGAGTASRAHFGPPRRQSSVDHEPIAIPAADARSPAWRAPRRSGAPYVVLATVAVCVIAGAAFYAYEAGLLPAVLDMPGALSTRDAASSATPGSAPATATPPNADATTRAAPEAPSAATIAPAVRPPAAPPPGPAMAPAPKPQAATSAPVQSPSTRTPATKPPAANESPATTAPVSPQLSQAPARSAATEDRRSSSRTVRPATREETSRSQSDKDALATQRLIERDLRGFLPPERPRDRESRSP